MSEANSLSNSRFDLIIQIFSLLEHSIKELRLFEDEVSVILLHNM